jgi:hypothetical protein
MLPVQRAELLSYLVVEAFVLSLRLLQDTART